MSWWCPKDQGRGGRRGWLGAIFGSVLLAVVASAPNAIASTLSGAVTAAGQPVAGVFVAATGPNGQAAALTGSCGGAYSLTCGQFSLTLPDGTYRLAASAPGYLTTAADGVTVSGASTQNLSVTASGAKLAPVPVFGGGRGIMAPGGSPGVFYDQGAGVGQIYRTVDYGGTWTQVTVARDDPANGLPGSQIPDLLTTSGFPGEVAVNIVGSVMFSTDYGVTWRKVGSSPQCGPGGGCQILWGHAGSISVLMFVEPQPSYAVYVADMTAASPSFLQMTAPYGAAGEPIAVGDGSDRPWVATVDSTGLLSVYPLAAQATAPAPTLTLAGFPANPIAVGIGGTEASGTPPAGVVVQSASAVAMTIKDADATTYPAPTSAETSCGTAASGVPAPAAVAPDTTGAYGAAAAGGCCGPGFSRHGHG